MRGIINWKLHYKISASIVIIILQDYFEVIKEPMCMGDIKKKLDNNIYNDADECLADFELMFNNCYEYNSVSFKRIFVKKKNALHCLFLSLKG